MTRAILRAHRALLLAPLALLAPLGPAGCGSESGDRGAAPHVSAPPRAAPPAVWDRIEEEDIEDARLRED